MDDEGPGRWVEVRVEPVPDWIDVTRWLGPFGWQRTAAHGGVQTRMRAGDAALLAARLRGLGLDGAKLSLDVKPALGRALVRAGRLAEARARRDTTPGFSRKDARASAEGRFSLTPEALAMPMATQTRGRSVLDACCGSGGNAIAFARAGCQVVAIDDDAERLEEALHNARLYGVAEGIRFLHGDARVLVPNFARDILFIDPPWGVDYDKARTTRSDFPLLDALLGAVEQGAAPRFGEIWLKLPASFATRSVVGAEPQVWFGERPGDRQRIKFLLLVLRTSAFAAPL